MDAIDDAAFRFFPACFTGFGVIKPLPPGHTGRDKEDWGMGKNIRCAVLIVWLLPAAVRLHCIGAGTL